ncbi:MAG: hypothetical protein ABSD58_18265 [Verrucomicrobiia bacterium]
MPVPTSVKGNQPTTKMMAKRTTVNHVRFGTRALVWILLVASRGAAQTQSPDVAATELVRQTVAHELAATDTGGQYMYQIHEATPQSSETSVTIETRDLQISRLILQNGQPLPPAQRQREKERLRSLLTNRARLMKLQTEQHSDEARVHRVIQVLPEAFLYQHAGAEKDSVGRELVLVTFRPNPDFRPPSTELRILQGVEGAMLIDPVAERIVRMEAKLSRDVDFGWGIIDHISRGGSLLLEQQVVWHDQWAMTALTLHFTNRLLLLITSRVDSVTKISDFRRMPDDLTSQQALGLLLDQDPMTAAVPGSEKIP